MKTYESSARTIEEAISAGLEVLGASISDVTVDIIDEGSKGLFGLFGSRLAKVRLTVNEQEEDLLASLMEDKPAKKPAKKAEKKPEPKQEKPKAEKPAEEKKPAPEKKEKAEPKAPKQPKPKQEKPKAEKAEKPAAEKKPLPPKAPAKPLEKPVVTMLENDQVEADSAAGKAQAFLKELTHLMGVEVDVAVGNDAEGNVFVKMTGDTLGILIGRRGETLDALQYLTSLKINRGQEGYTRVTLDTENYRAKREDTLIRLANRMANRAVKTGRKVSLEPMNPYERRIIHSALQANEAVDTHSEGDEPNRHVVITLRK
ncbi:MAG: protein jag [Clostridia bacterium]|nr:protein jag [Clostridia bacterium]